jgi:dTDP-4-dehydrorhamnose 3,5-epimerase-like enzyme
MDLIYSVTHYFDNTDEHGIKWDDPTARVPWRVEEPILSGGDRSAPSRLGELQQVLRASV